MSADTIRSTPPFTMVTWDTREEEIVYRSVPGRGTSLTRRIDISSALDMTVRFERIRPSKDGVERTPEGTFVLDGGIPLMWVVPADSQMEDILVTISPYPIFLDSDGRIPSPFVYIGDHWHSS